MQPRTPSRPTSWLLLLPNELTTECRGQTRLPSRVVCAYEAHSRLSRRTYRPGNINKCKPTLSLAFAVHSLIIDDNLTLLVIYSR